MRNAENKLVKYCDIVVANPAAGNGVTRKVIVIGDSTTNAGVTTQRLLDHFSTDVMKIELLGSLGSGSNKHEGRSGWMYSNYINDTSFNNFTNAFWDGTKFNFPWYMSQKGYTSVDHVIINLGINDTLQVKSLDDVVTQAKAMIASIKAFNANIKIGICLPIPPSVEQRKFGSWKTKQRYRRDLFNLYKRFITEFDNRLAENIYIVPIYTNLDTVYNMETEQVPVNANNNTLITVNKDNIHPAASGYYQIADVYYYYLKSFEA